MAWKNVLGGELSAAKLLARLGVAMLSSVQQCRGCLQKNRVLFGRRKPRCGCCGLPLKEEKLD